MSNEPKGRINSALATISQLIDEYAMPAIKAYGFWAGLAVAGLIMLLVVGLYYVWG